MHTLRSALRGDLGSGPSLARGHLSPLPLFSYGAHCFLRSYPAPSRSWFFLRTPLQQGDPSCSVGPPWPFSPGAQHPRVDPGTEHVLSKRSPRLSVQTEACVCLGDRGWVRGVARREAGVGLGKAPTESEPRSPMSTIRRERPHSSGVTPGPRLGSGP